MGQRRGGCGCGAEWGRGRKRQVRLDFPVHTGAVQTGCNLPGAKGASPSTRGRKQRGAARVESSLSLMLLENDVEDRGYLNIGP